MREQFLCQPKSPSQLFSRGEYVAFSLHLISENLLRICLIEVFKVPTPAIDESLQSHFSSRLKFHIKLWEKMCISPKVTIGVIGGYLKAMTFLTTYAFFDHLW